MYNQLDLMSKEIHAHNKAKGFWDDEYNLLATLGNVEQVTSVEEFDEVVKPMKKAFTGQRIALMHSELSEALEADRKDLQDDKLPQYKGLDVELADCLIRILDFCGAHKIQIGEITQAKLDYNKIRAFKHGKSY